MRTCSMGAFAGMILAIAPEFRAIADELPEPLMVAEDKNFGVGHLGFGSFDDKGRIRNIRIYGRTSEERSFTGFGAKTK